MKLYGKRLLLAGLASLAFGAWGIYDHFSNKYHPNLEAHFLGEVLMSMSVKKYNPYPCSGNVPVYYDGELKNMHIHFIDCGGDYKPDFGLIMDGKEQIGVVLERESPMYDFLKEVIENVQPQPEEGNLENMI